MSSNVRLVRELPNEMTDVAKDAFLEALNNKEIVC